MGFGCPYNSNDFCEKRKQKCEVLAVGCVLSNKVETYTTPVVKKKEKRKKGE